jgi:hypothetical protein|nr:MAG TPA: hypothetical protein [Caudoviricetes sp.]
MGVFYLLKQRIKCGKSDNQIRKDVYAMLDEDYNEYIRVYDAKQALLAIKRVIRMNKLENALKILMNSYTYYEADLFYKAFVEKYINILRSEMREKN